jgi:hypothetical protein
MANKRLVTESDVRAMARGSELVLGPDVIATPAALDLAFERGLALVRRDASGATAASAAQCACTPANCTWKQVLASDGTYVVVVKSGVPSISKLTERGPVPFAKT